jgi:hypothetical protein
VIDIEIQIRRKRLILKDFRELQSREAAEADVARTVGDGPQPVPYGQHSMRSTPSRRHGGGQVSPKTALRPLRKSSMFFLNRQDVKIHANYATSDSYED